MKREDIEQWDKDTMAMVLDPQAGDQFTEHLGSQMYVVRRLYGKVAIRRVVIERYKRKWGPLRLISLSEFRKVLTYDNIPDKTIYEGWRKGHYPRFLEQKP